MYEVRGKQVKGDNYIESLSHQKIPKVAAPHYESWGELLRFLIKENLPGDIPIPPESIRTGAPGEDPSGCLPARARRSGPTVDSITQSGPAGHAAVVSVAMLTPSGPCVDVGRTCGSSPSQRDRIERSRQPRGPLALTEVMESTVGPLRRASPANIRIGSSPVPPVR